MILQLGCTNNPIVYNSIMLKFNKPTLITLTAPTCAGKSHLLEAMIDSLGCQRIVSTTDRWPRAEEIQGVHYDFLNTTESVAYEEANLFAELVTYNGVRYGVTHLEMDKKMANVSSPPVVIVEPNGVPLYRKYCASKGWNTYLVFVSVNENIRLDRLAKRTARDAVDAMYRLGTDEKAAADTMLKIIQANNNRLKAVLEQERSWANKERWDLYVPGDDLEKALQYLEEGVRARNSQSYA